MTTSTRTSSSVSSGIGSFAAVGHAIAVMISWGIAGGHLGWATWDGLWGWLYVIWRVFIAGCYQNCG